MSEKFRATPGWSPPPNSQTQATPWAFEPDPEPRRRTAAMPIWPWLLGGAVILVLLIIVGGMGLLILGFRATRQAQMQARMAAVEAETLQAHAASAKVKEDMAKERAEVGKLTDDLKGKLRRLELARDPDQRLGVGPAPLPELRPLPPELVAQRWPYIVIVESVEVKPTKANGQLWDLAGAYETPDPYVVVTRDDAVRQRLYNDLTAEISRIRAVETLWQQQKNLEKQLQQSAEGSPQRKRIEQSLQQVQDAGARPLTDEERNRLRDLLDQANTLLRQYSYTTPVVQDRYTATYNSGDVGVSVGDIIQLRVLDKDVLFDDEVGTTKLSITDELIKDGRIDVEFGQVKVLKLRFEKVK